MRTEVSAPWFDFFAQITQGKDDGTLERNMSSPIKHQPAPSGVVSENADAPQDVVSASEKIESVVIVMARKGAAGYHRLAQWSMLGTPTLVHAPGSEVDAALAKSLVLRLAGHLRGEGAVVA